MVITQTHGDVQRDLNFINTEINIFSETRCLTSNNDITYDINGYSLFRNDSQSLTSRPFFGMAAFSRVEFLPGYPCCRNVNGIEITIMRVIICQHGSPKIPLQPVRNLISASGLIKFSF